MTGSGGPLRAPATSDGGRRTPRRPCIRPFAVAIIAAAVVAPLFVGRASSRVAPAPRTGAVWHALPRAPIVGRIGEAVVWTGKELIVAGGLTRRSDGTSGRASDGAAYVPATGKWRMIASPPAGVGAGAVWTGGAVVTWTGNMPDGPAVGAVYNPRTNSWRRLPDGPLGVREGNADVWTGKELLVIGGYSGDRGAVPIAAAVDPATASWRVLHGLDRLTLFGGPNGAVWDGREAIIAGNLSLCPGKGSGCTRTRPILVAYNPSTDRMRELKLPSYSDSFRAGTARSLTPLSWTGSEGIFRAREPGSLRVLRYEAASGRWQIGATAPCVLPHGSDTQTAWAGNRFVAPCAADSLQIYGPASGSWQWRTLVPGASPLNSAAGSATAWTGTQLIVWSGRTFQRFNPTPSDGASLVLGK